MTGPSPAAGLVCAVGSALFNGSFTVPFKVKGGGGGGAASSSSIVHPIVFTLYVSLGVFLSSWLVLPFLRLNPHLLEDGDNEAAQPLPADRFRLSFLGVVAGWLFVLGVAASFVAIDRIGIALAQGIWAGSATVVSYVWGTLVFAERPAAPVASAAGLALLVAGVVGIALSETIGKSRLVSKIRRLLRGSSNGGAEAGRLLSGQKVDYGDQEHEEGSPSLPAINSGHYVKGVLWACSVGLFGGSILAPTHYLPHEKQGLVIMPSFGIGTVTLAPLVLLANVLWTRDAPPMKIRRALVPGLLSGSLWNVSNLLSIIAIPAIGYGVAYPLLQAAVMVSGLWGVFVFQEITEPATIMCFWMGSAVLLLGAATLAASQ